MGGGTSVLELGLLDGWLVVCFIPIGWMMSGMEICWVWSKYEVLVDSCGGMFWLDGC